MIKKIISWGQTGAGRAALDVAIELGIPHSGWIPGGIKREIGSMNVKDHIEDISGDAESIEKNVIESDGSLIISKGKLKGGSAHTREMANKHKRPLLSIDLKKTNAFKAAEEINTWIKKHDIRILYVASPPDGKDPAIYHSTVKLLKAAFYLDEIESKMPDPYRVMPFHPQSVEEAVDRLIIEMPLKEKVQVAKMEAFELPSLYPNLGQYIRSKFGLWWGNEDLINSCRYLSGKYDIQPNDAEVIIIEALWDELRKTHRPRLVK